MTENTDLLRFRSYSLAVLANETKTITDAVSGDDSAYYSLRLHEGKARIKVCKSTYKKIVTQHRLESGS
jgi:hypothetical protein